MSAELRGLRIMIVDDNAQMRSIVGSVLTAAGVGTLHYAQDGQDALELLEYRDVDAIYLDYEMPRVNGMDALRRIRKLSSGKRYLPVVMLTAHADMIRINEARDGGVNEFLCKPVTARAILTRLEALIAQHRPFVMTPGYVGPDRRRRADPAYCGEERRQGIVAERRARA